LYKTRQNAQIFEEILFFQAMYNTKTNISLIFCQLDACSSKEEVMSHALFPLQASSGKSELFVFVL